MEAAVRSLAAVFLQLDRVTTWVVGIAASIALAVAVAAGFWQVTTRFVLSSPATWSEALVRLALIWMVLLGLAVALRQGALVSIDIAHRYSQGKARRILEAAALLSNLFLLVVLFWYGWEMTNRVRMQEMAGLEISIAWGYAAIPVGCIFAAIGAIANFLDHRSEELESAV
jgi:TRAP-type C4-dicarboxylate transport system permease small subunit